MRKILLIKFGSEWFWLFRKPCNNVKYKQLLSFLLVLFFSVLTNSTKAAAISSTATGGNWNVPGTWVGNVVPAANDDVTIVANAQVTVTISTATIRSLTVNGTLNVNVGVFNVNIANNGFVIIGATGTVVFGATNLITGGQNGANRGVQLTVQTGATLRTANEHGFSSLFDVSNRYLGSLNIGPGNNPTRAAVYQSGVNVEYNGAAAQSTGNAFSNINNLTINNQSGVTLARAITITGNLTIGNTVANSVFSDGGFAINRSGTGNFTLGSGKFNIGSASSGTTFPAYPASNISLASGTTIEYLSGVSQVVSLTPTYHHLIMSGAGTKTTGTGNLVINGHLNVGGTYNYATSGSTVLTVARNLLGNGTLVQGSGPINLNGDWLFTGNFTPSGSEVSLRGSSNQINGAAGLAFNVLKVEAGGSYTNNNPGTITVQNNLSGSGSFIQAANSSLAINGSLDIATLNAAAIGNTVTYGGGDQIIKAIPYHHLHLTTTSGSRTKNISNVQTINGNFNLSAPDGSSLSATATVSMTIGGTFAIGENASFSAGNLVHYVGGNWSNDGTFDTPKDVSLAARVIFNGSGPQTIAATTFNHLSFENTGIKSAQGPLSIQGDVSINSGSTFDAGGHTHSVRGSWTNNGTFLASGSTIRFNGVSSTQAIGSSNFHHIELENNATKMATGSLNIAGDVIINTNFSAGSYNHTVGGNWENNGSGTVPFTSGTSTITFNGANDQEIRSTLNRTTSFNHFVINKPGGKLRIMAPVTISRLAGFVSGIIEGTSNTTPLLFIENASIDPAAVPSNISFVNGPVRKSVSSVNAASRNFVFPVGKNGKYVPIEISNATGLGTTLEGEYFAASAYTLGTRNAAGPRQVSQCEYWVLRRTGSGNPTMDVTLGWGPDNACTGLTYISDPASLVVTAFDAGTNSWRNYGGAAASGSTAASGRVTWTGVTNVQAFTLGTMSLSNTLPVVLAHFTATQREEGVVLAFANLTEENVALYHVERSADGTGFQSIGTVMPRSNTNSRADYTFLDQQPLSGTGYYRIRALEANGNLVYSDVVMLRTTGRQNSFVLYPNPARLNTTLSLQMGNLQAGRYSVKVFNQAGQLLHINQFSHAGGFVSAPVPTQGLAAGTYFIELNGQQKKVQRLVLR